MGPESLSTRQYEFFIALKNANRTLKKKDYKKLRPGMGTDLVDYFFSSSASRFYVSYDERKLSIEDHSNIKRSMMGIIIPSIACDIYCHLNGQI